jgi:hypothetical protein
MCAALANLSFATEKVLTSRYRKFEVTPHFSGYGVNQAQSFDAGTLLSLGVEFFFL